MAADALKAYSGPPERGLFPMASIYRAAFASLGFALVCSGAHADFNIAKKPTQNVSCSGGVCMATAKNAILNVHDLTNMLAAGDVTVKYGGGALAIQIDDGFSWTSGSHLTLDANTSIGVHKPVIVAGQGALTITYNDGGTGGDLKFFDKGKIDLWNLSSNFTVNGKSYALVGNVGDLATEIHDDPSGYFALANDYDATQDGTYTHPPVATTFDGVFEGLGHQVTNFSMIVGHSGDLGFFQFIDTPGVVRDLILANAFVSSNSVRGNTYLGTMAGRNYGMMLNVHAQGSAAASGSFSEVGGLVGVNSGPLIAAAADVAVSGQFAGGLVGFSDGEILRSHASGTASGSYGAGGLVDTNVGSIAESYASGRASVEFQKGENGAGGLVNELYYHLNSGTVSNSYAIGAATGVSGGPAGGLAASANGKQGASSISESYSVGVVSGGANSVLGGVLGKQTGQGALVTDYWDTDTSGRSTACGKPTNCQGAAGLNDANLRSGLPDGFDPNIWGSNPNINNGYPYLLANPPQ